jgi:hypothetical protein
VRELFYGNIRLVAVDNGEWPFNREGNRDKWHVPGRRYATTDELVKLATMRGITVTLSEVARDGQTTVRLN